MHPYRTRLDIRAVSDVESAKPTTSKKPQSSAPAAKPSEISFSNNKTQSVDAFPTPTSSTSSSPYHVISSLAPTTPSALVPIPATRSESPAAETSSSSMDQGASPISGGAIGGIVVAVVGAMALSLVAILFVKRRKRGTRRPSISRRVSSFGQAEFFAGPSPASPPPMSQTYGSMSTPPLAAGPVPAAAYHAGPNSTFAHAPFATPMALPPMPPPPPQQQQQQQQQQQYYEPDPWQQQPTGVHTVVSTYTPTLDDEIYVHPGDQVQVYTEYDDGWCLGVNLTRGNARGVFPKHCIHGSASPSMASSAAPSLAPNDKVHRNSNRGSSLILDG